MTVRANRRSSYQVTADRLTGHIEALRSRYPDDLEDIADLCHARDVLERWMSTDDAATDRR